MRLAVDLHRCAAAGPCLQGQDDARASVGVAYLVADEHEVDRDSERARDPGLSDPFALLVGVDAGRLGAAGDERRERGTQGHRVYGASALGEGAVAQPRAGLREQARGLPLRDRIAVMSPDEHQTRLSAGHRHEDLAALVQVGQVVTTEERDQLAGEVGARADGEVGRDWSPGHVRTDERPTILFSSLARVGCSVTLGWANHQPSRMPRVTQATMIA